MIKGLEKFLLEITLIMEFQLDLSKKLLDKFKMPKKKNISVYHAHFYKFIMKKFLIC